MHKFLDKMKKNYLISEKKETNGQIIPWVNGLKGLAILFLLIYHTGMGKGVHILSRTSDNIWCRLGGHGGKIAIGLFFLISSFLIYKSLYAYFDKKDYSLRTALSWIKKKFVRFMPLFYLAIIVCSFWPTYYCWIHNISDSLYQNSDDLRISLHHPLDVYMHSGFKNLIIHLLFLHGFFPQYCADILGVEWYIGVLAIFICIAVFIFKYINSFWKSVLLFGISVPLCHYINTYLYTLTPNIWPGVYQHYLDSFGIIVNFPTLCLGIVLYYTYIFLQQSAIKHKVRLSYVLFLACLLLLLANLYVAEVIPLMNTRTVWALLVSLLIISQMLHTNALIGHKFLQFLGVYSLPIYLFHYGFICLYRTSGLIKLHHSVLNWVVELSIVLIMCVLSSLILVRFIEKPMIALLLRHSPDTLTETKHQSTSRQTTRRR